MEIQASKVKIYHNTRLVIGCTNSGCLQCLNVKMYSAKQFVDRKYCLQ